MIHRDTFFLILKVLVLVILIAVERAGGLPVWFAFGALSLVQPYDWQTRLILLVTLSVSLSLSYVLPFALGFGLIWVAAWITDHLEPYVKSQTLRLLMGTVLVIGSVSLFKHTSWNWVTVGFHLLSLGLVVTLYRLYMGYQVLAPQRLQLSRRLRNLN